MPRSPSHARDAALARMRRINRWLIAGAVALTALLTDVTAHAFPGRTITPGAKSLSAPRSGAAVTAVPRRRATHAVLTPPAQAPQPQAQPQTTTVPPTAPTQLAPTQVASGPVAPAPVVSGGS